MSTRNALEFHRCVQVVDYFWIKKDKRKQEEEEEGKKGMVCLLMINNE